MSDLAELLFLLSTNRFNTKILTFAVRNEIKKLKKTSTRIIIESI